jgi:REP element-mobilizing transposase RayT
MGDAYTSCHIHYVFSTKERRPLILPAYRERLWAYMGGIAREHRMCAVQIGGTVDHVHLLVRLPATLAIAKGVQLLKAGSSKWVHDTFPDLPHFAWQAGYGAFSLSPSSVPSAVEYIVRQDEHHRRHTFQEEFLAFLTRYDVAYDARYIWQ